MPENIEEQCKKILELVEELESVYHYKEQFDSEAKKLFDDYQGKKFGYFHYEKSLKSLLKGKTRKEWDMYYSHQVFHILKRIEYLNGQIFYQMYAEKPEVMAKPAEKAMPIPAAPEKRKALFPFLRKPRKEAEEAKTVEEKLMPEAPEAIPEAPLLEKLAEKEKPEMEELRAAIEEAAREEPQKKPYVPLKPYVPSKQHIPVPKQPAPARKKEAAKREAEKEAAEIEKKPYIPYAKPEIPMPEKEMEMPKPEREKVYIIEKPVIREIIKEAPRPEERLKPMYMRKGMPEIPAAEAEEIEEKPEKAEKATRIKERRFIQPQAMERPLEAEIPRPGERKRPEEAVETRITIEEKPVPFWRRILPFGGRARKPAGAPGAKTYQPELKITKGAKKRMPFAEKPEKVTFASRITGIFGVRKKKTTFDMILEEEKKLKTETGAVKMKSPLATVMGNFARRLTLRETPEGKKKRLIEKDMRIRFLRSGTTMDKQSLEHISGSLIKKEAKRIQQIMTKQKQLKLYKPTAIGTIANVSVRDLSYSLVDFFPDMFRRLYNNMRLANIKILSNTYVNMMVFSTIVTTLASLVILPTLFYLQGQTLAMALLQAVMLAIAFGAITFLAFYTYPIIKIKERRRSIKTNLPFALNHMAAVASSGVPPNVLFKLISSSKEYGEICIEAEKINQFVTIFGYDLLSAMKTVAETTPSKEFKDFLDGMISTIESGGNLQQFLSENSKAALLSYELDRQKYTETIATYSDIYTGLLIAAPLFFVAALSLISILGGGIGGVSVDVIITVGTYIALPLLNIIFLVFLEVTQPEF